MIAINPKLEFKFRTLQNWAYCFAGFAVWAFVFSSFPYRWLIYLIGIGIANYVFFFVLDKRSSLITCPECTKQLATNTPWVCGVCGKDNLQVDDFPFTHKCQHCGIEPKAYKCHHPKCGHLIFFTEDKQKKNYARCLVAETPESPPEDKSTLRKEEKEEVLHTIDMVKHKAELEEIEEMLKSRKRTKKEQIEESFMNYRGSVMGARAFAREWKALKTRELKDDPEALEDELETMKSWLLDKGIE